MVQRESLEDWLRTLFSVLDHDRSDAGSHSGRSRSGVNARHDGEVGQVLDTLEPAPDRAVILDGDPAVPGQRDIREAGDVGDRGVRAANDPVGAADFLIGQVVVEDVAQKPHTDPIPIWHRIRGPPMPHHSLFRVFWGAAVTHENEVRDDLIGLQPELKVTEPTPSSESFIVRIYYNGHRSF